MATIKTETVRMNDGTPVEKQTTDKGVMYTLRQTTLENVLNSIEGDVIQAQRLSKKCLLLNGVRYYLGPTLVNKSENEIAESANLISIQVSCKEADYQDSKTNWVHCMFMPQNVKTITFHKKH